jgi:hypothetical protein
MSGENDVFRQIGFNTNNVIAAVIKASGQGMTLTNVERNADQLPKEVLVAIETDVALPALSEPSPLMFTKHCGACHGANGDIPLFSGSEAEIKQAIKKPELAKEIYKRLNWEADSDSSMPPAGSKQRDDLNKTNHRPQMMRLVEAAAFGLPENPTGNVGGNDGFDPTPGPTPGPMPGPTPTPGPTPGPAEPFKLGVSIQTINWNNEPWVRLATVSPTGRAYAAGMRNGDILRRINNVPIASEAQFDTQLANAVATGTVRIMFYRPSGNTTVPGEAVIPVTGGGNPSPGPIPTPATFKLGVSIETIFWNNENWVRFKAVDPTGRAAAVGMKAGDMILRINDKKVYSEADYDTYYAQAVSSGSVVIKFRRFTGNQSNDYTATIPVQ